MLFELIWSYRFLYRDLNDLLSKNRRLETHFQFVLRNKRDAVRAMLDGLARARAFMPGDTTPAAAHGATRLDPFAVETVSTAMVVVLTYWLNFEYVRDPRRALEPESANRALLRGAQHVLGLLRPYLETSQRDHLIGLAGRYGDLA